MKLSPFRGVARAQSTLLNRLFPGPGETVPAEKAISQEQSFCSKAPII